MTQPTAHRNRMYQIGTAVAALLFVVGLALVLITLFNQKQPHDSLKYTNNVPAAIAPMPSDHSGKNPHGPVLTSSHPVRLKIPAIQLNDQLINLGKNKDGSVQVPAGKHVDDPGWYKYSPTPGAYGASVILGHVDDVNGPSSFWRLDELKPSEKIEVSRADGMTAVFTINKVQLYRKDNFPTQKVYTSDNTAALRLITCGRFDKATGKYEGNIVVFATLTSSHR